MKILVTGATGKVGQKFLEQISCSELMKNASAVALCHNRLIDPTEKISVVKGSIADKDTVDAAMNGITHVVHLATCKETPSDVMDVTVKGLFWLLEACREKSDFEQFLLIGGDAGMGHFFYPHPIPVTETQKHSAYPGCYALSKVLEEVMLEQYQIQYSLPSTCLRAPWIMEKMILNIVYRLVMMSSAVHGKIWFLKNLPKNMKKLANTINAYDNGEPIKRNFIHVDDLVQAIMQAILLPDKANGNTFNISMDTPVDYGEVSKYLKDSRGIESIPIKTQYHSTWLDNSKAKFLLDWKPKIGLKELIDLSWNYERSNDDPRKIRYPG